MLTPLDPREQQLLRQTLGQRCRQAREQLGLTAAALASALGRSAAWLRAIESGKRPAPADLVAALSRATSLPAGWFFGQADTDLEALARKLVEQIEAEGPRSVIPECFEV